MGSVPDGDELMRLALEATGDGPWDWDMAEGTLRMSGRFLAKLGYAPGEVPQSVAGLRSIVHPEDWEQLHARFEAHLSSAAEFFECEYRVRGADGWVWNRDRGRIIARAPDGTPLRMVGTSRDISAEKAAAVKARENSELLMLAQEGAGAGTWDLDLDTYFVRLCPRSREMHGLPVDESGPISHQEWAARVYPDDLAAIRTSLDEAIRNGTIYTTEFRTVSETGTRWILGLGQVIGGGEGAADRFVGLNIDISRRKGQEEALRRAEADLLQLSRLNAMGTMGSMLAHELNQPLAAVANYLSAVRKMLPEQVLGEQPRIGQALNRAEECVLRSGDIIRRLREFVAGGKLHARAEPLEPIVRESAAIALDGVTGRLPELRVELASEAARVFADRIQIQQVLVNLVRNACEAMEGVERPVLDISARMPEPGRVEIAVSDRGGGVPMQLDETLFSPFVTTKSDGMGVGLAICRTIVEAHGGRIWAEPREGGGTSFRFTVPAG